MIYYSCKKIGKSKFRRKTKEVDIVVQYDKNSVMLIGKGDCSHHLLEDSAILLKHILGGH